jgi:hypothetical protein
MMARRPQQSQEDTSPFTHVFRSGGKISIMLSSKSKTFVRVRSSMSRLQGARTQDGDAGAADKMAHGRPKTVDISLAGTISLAQNA